MAVLTALAVGLGCSGEERRSTALGPAEARGAEALPTAAPVLVPPTQTSPDSSTRAAEPDDGDSIEVRVRAPGPGMLELWLLDIDGDERRAYREARRAARSRDAWTLVESFGTRIARVDVAGDPPEVSIRVREPDRAATVVARTGDRVGRERGSKIRDRRLEIELNEPLVLPVSARVVTGDGTPVPGIEVHFGSKVVASTWATEDPGAWTLAPQRTLDTDEQGLAKVHWNDADLRSAVRIPPQHVFFGVDPEPSDQPQLIRLPSGGSLTVEVQGAEGAVELTLGVGELAAQILRCSLDPGSTTATFPWVPVDEELVLHVVDPGRSELELEVRPITAPGGRRTVSAVLEPWYVVEALVVDRDGNAVVDAEFECFRESGRTRHWIGEVTTDDAGSLRLQHPTMAELAAGDRLVVERNSLRAVSRAWARSDPLAEPTGGAWSAGRLVLAEPGVALSGRLVSTFGAPLEGVSISAHPAAAPRPGERHGRPRTDVVGPGGSDGRRTVSARERTDADGRFEFRLPPSLRSSEWLELRSETRDYLPVRSGPYEFGARDVVMVVAAESRILVDLSQLPSRVAARVRFDLTLDGREVAPSMVVRRGTETELHGLLPGIYALEARDRTKRIARVDGLVVVEGEVCGDPRLSPLLVDEELEALELLVVDERGEPLADAWLYSLDGDEEYGDLWFSDLGRIQAWRDGRRSARVAVGCHGYRTRVLDGAPAAGRIALEPGLRRELLFAPGLLSEDPVEVKFRSEDELHGPSMSSVDCPARDGGTPSYVFPAPGNYLAWIPVSDDSWLEVEVQVEEGQRIVEIKP